MFLQFSISKLNSLVSAVLTVFPGLEGDLAVAVLDAEVGGVVPRLHGSSEECPTGRTHLQSETF